MQATRKQHKSTSQFAPYSFLPGVRGAEKRKEELSELQEGALQAPSKRSWGGGGNQEGTEGRGKDERQEEGDESARPQRARAFGDATATQVLEAEGVRPASQLLRPGQRRTKWDEEPTSISPVQPRPSGRVDRGCSALAG